MIKVQKLAQASVEECVEASVETCVETCVEASVEASVEAKHMLSPPAASCVDIHLLGNRRHICHEDDDIENDPYLTHLSYY